MGALLNLSHEDAREGEERENSRQSNSLQPTVAADTAVDTPGR